MLNRLIRALIENKIISKQDYEKIINIQNTTGEEIDEVLIKNRFIDENMFYEIISKEFNIKNITLDKILIPSKIIKTLPKEIVKKYHVIPFDIKGNSLHVAMYNPLNSSAIEDIRFITNKQVIPYIEKKSKILCAMETYYESHVLDTTSYALKEETDEKMVESASIVKLTNSIINEAIIGKASDIHIEPSEKGSIVRFRIDGLLREEMVIPKEIYPLICTRIKIKSGMDISQKMLPQDGKMEYKFKNEDFDLRISSIPILYGEKIVIRILYKLNRAIYLDSLVTDARQREKIKSILNHPNGIILVTGPTGSGKTTTLCAMLNHLNSREKNIITIEDPVEYAISGINQMNVNSKAGLTFSKGLRSILRQDPDIIMVGEIRDEETAEIAIKAAITGHLVLSTLHTNNASSAIVRLADMNVPNYLIADSLVAIIAQRLLRKICDNCKSEYYPTEGERRILCVDDKFKVFKGKGCRMCNGSGYKGRSALFEVMYISNNHRELIRQKCSSMEINEFSVKGGMSTLNSKCKELVKNGITTIDEMMRVCYENI
ncbi:type II secretion system protein GspE [Clostridium bovifaecis]|uniref:Type II secretion system protein GspE n=1 Tax=Clostridium bovifaecis TaxID=2184719 RepID=A0A6I6F1I9_9CLOT|nr:type II secretion system protein GspE [Clostridium bovifaecis]